MDTKLMGARIKNARQLRQVTLDQVAARIGVNKSTVQRYENGLIRSPKIPVIQSIANALDVNYLWLTGESGDIEPVSGDEEIARYLSLLESRPELRSLLKTAKDANVEQVQAVVDFLTAFRNGHG